MPPIILIGHPASQSLLPASAYLTSKYLPGFSISYLNYEGPKEGWSQFVSDHLKTLSDEKIILALDDYLLSGFDEEAFKRALGKSDYSVAVKLCPNTPEEFEEYPVSTQYTIWNRQFLVELLRQTTDPWHFEMTGSSLFKETGLKADIEPCIEYGVHSALSSRWEGVRMDGVKPEDIAYLQTHELI